MIMVLLKKGNYITDNDIIISKMFKKNKNGKEITNCFGKRINFGTSGIVDKVVVVLKIKKVCVM